MGRRFLKGLLPSKSKPLEISNPMVSPSLAAKLTQKQLDEYTPKSQPYYTFSGSKWQRGTPSQEAPLGGTNEEKAAGPAISNLRLLTWNIDFMAPFPQARMAAALAYLETVVDGTPPSTAVVICLQELRQDVPIDLGRGGPGVGGRGFDPQIADDLRQVAAAGWVQARFVVSDLATDHWRCGYNCVTLVDRRLGVAGVARLPFVSEYRREALLVDIIIAVRPPSGGGGGGGGDKTEHGGAGAGGRSVLRICNVHLDSMAGNPPMRPIQWKACAKYLQRESDGVAGGILAGDCNANQDYDLTLAEENGFKDAYLEMGGKDGDPKGHTWGPQSKSSRFPHKRMDKVCFCQPAGSGEDQQLLNLKSLEKIGVGVKIGDEAISAKLADEGWLDFVTDHYGLMADFEIGKAWALGVETGG